MAEIKPAVFKNISPLGDLDLPLLDRIVAAGEEFEVTPAQAVELFGQPEVWECVSGHKTFAHLLEPTPKLASGGIVPGNSISFVAEDDKPEAIIPLTEPKGDTK